jgi:hypothetical protein
MYPPLEYSIPLCILMLVIEFMPYYVQRYVVRRCPIKTLCIITSLLVFYSDLGPPYHVIPRGSKSNVASISVTKKEEKMPGGDVPTMYHSVFWQKSATSSADVCMYMYMYLPYPPRFHSGSLSLRVTVHQPASHCQSAG